jgi:hypothetical protein
MTIDSPSIRVRAVARGFLYGRTYDASDEFTCKVSDLALTSAHPTVGWMEPARAEDLAALEALQAPPVVETPDADTQ